MGRYINIGNGGFRSARNSEYVDKSGLISVVNATIDTEKRFSCVTRCRRFGKSMAAKMLCAYYDCSCDSRTLFEDLEIAGDPTFGRHLNKYPVIYLDLTSFVTQFRERDDIVDHIQAELKTDILREYPDVEVSAEDDLMNTLIDINRKHGAHFVLIIDEWDAICREFENGSRVMDHYVNWLRRMFKDVNANDVFALVYMTGILPIKKYKTESALNNFAEYSMVNPSRMARFFGFTREEVHALCRKHGMDAVEMERWYDGYQIGEEQSMFNPNSVTMAVWNSRCRSYWSATGAYDAVAAYINLNYEGLKDDVIAMMAGARCPVNSTRFNNDIADINSRDDVLTVLIHLGYLSFDWNEEECYIPNKEVAGEIENAIRKVDWREVTDSLDRSKKLLRSTLDGDAEAVAAAVDAAHSDNTSILSYNDENSLACVLSIAFYYAKNEYVFHRELASGRGFADLVLIPRKHVDKPAILLELKYNEDADTALRQIREKRYAGKALDYADRLLLVGINYDRKSKTHTCRIEPYMTTLTRTP